MVPTRTQDELPPQLQDALNRGLLERLPITFLPFTRQQLREWPFLFPYERQSVLRLLLYVASLNNDQFAAIFQKVVQLENKMGVRNWQFSLDQQTILNASLLARSPYYQEWRIAVQKVFDAAEEHAQVENVKSAQVHRCIILILPRALPTSRQQQCGADGKRSDGLYKSNPLLPIRLVALESHCWFPAKQVETYRYSQRLRRGQTLRSGAPGWWTPDPNSCIAR